MLFDFGEQFVEVVGLVKVNLLLLEKLLNTCLLLVLHVVVAELKHVWKVFRHSRSDSSRGKGNVSRR